MVLIAPALYPPAAAAALSAPALAKLGTYPVAAPPATTPPEREILVPLPTRLPAIGAAILCIAALSRFCFLIVLRICCSILKILTSLFNTCCKSLGSAAIVFTIASSNAARCWEALFIPIISAKALLVNLVNLKNKTPIVAVIPAIPGPAINLPIPSTIPLPKVSPKPSMAPPLPKDSIALLTNPRVLLIAGSKAPPPKAAPA